MRAIDGDALIDKYGDWYTEEGAEEGYIGTIKGIIDSMPTIEPERESIKWIPHESIFGGLGERVYTCNKCGHNIGFHVENFCPNCGGKYEG